MEASDIQHVVINFRRPIALFPLPGAVLLPHGLMPLHIFESRYRRMATDVIDSTGLIAMASFRGSPDQHQYLHGRPALREHVCIGYCQQYEKLDDGRFLVLLQGLCRARIVNEVDHRPYRKAILEPTELEPARDEQMTNERDRLEGILHDPVFDRLETVVQIRRLIEEPVPTAALVDLTISQLCRDPEQRYVMLGASDARDRAAWLNRHLDELVRTGDLGALEEAAEGDGFDDADGWSEPDADDDGESWV